MKLVWQNFHPTPTPLFDQTFDAKSLVKLFAKHFIINDDKNKNIHNSVVFYSIAVSFQLQKGKKKSKQSKKN